MGNKLRLKKDLISIFIIIAIALLWWIIVFSGFQPLDQCDWDKYFTFHELQRKTILFYRQFPLWSPYLSGGTPWLARPNSDFLSPYFIFILFFGTIQGTIIIYLIQAVTGLLGMYFLSRHYGLGYILSLLSSIFFLNIFNILTFVGGFTFLNISFLPWIYLFFQKSKIQKKYLLVASVLLALIIYAGNIYIFIMTCMIISIDAIYYAIVKKEAKFILLLLKIALFVLFLGGIKLFPMLELLNQYPRHTGLPPFPGFLNMNNIYAGLLELRHFFFSRENTYIASRFINEEMIGYHFSIITISLFVLSVFLLWRKYKILVAINAIFLLLALGDNSPVNLWRILHFFLSAFKEPKKFFGPLIAMLSLSLGLVIQELQKRLPRLLKLPFFAVLILFSLISFNVFNCARKIFKESTIIRYNLSNRESAFSQSSGNSKKMFESIYNNQGLVYGYDNIGSQIQTKVIPRERQGYRGEYFLLNNSGKVEQIYFSANKLKFSIAVEEEDILVINQNYFPGWHSFQGQVINHRGLIGIPVNRYNREITMYYLPNSFLIGTAAFVFFISIIVWMRKIPKVRALLYS
ncbi:hypothetical protein KJA13_02755 [Patescibacteria group bacterium]|nr:hypothetical protein [Patescibacteria group bacterium]